MKTDRPLIPDPRLPTPIWRAVLELARLELLLSLRRGESLLVALLIPLALLVFFGSVPLLPAGDRPPIEFLLPGILALAVMSSGLVSLGIATAFERHYGVLKRLGGTPLPRSGLLAAKLLAVLAIQTLQVGLLALAALLLGWSGPRQLVGPLGVLVLGSVAFSALGLLLAGTLRAEATLGAANGLYLVFLLLGDMIVPLRLLPGWVEALARWLPAAALAGALRSALSPGAELSTESLLVLLAWTVAACLAAARTFRWE